MSWLKFWWEFFCYHICMVIVSEHETWENVHANSCFSTLINSNPLLTSQGLFRIELYVSTHNIHTSVICCKFLAHLQASWFGVLWTCCHWVYLSHLLFWISMEILYQVFMQSSTFDSIFNLQFQLALKMVMYVWQFSTWILYFLDMVLTTENSSSNSVEYEVWLNEVIL